MSNDTTPLLVRVGEPGTRLILPSYVYATLNETVRAQLPLESIGALLGTIERAAEEESLIVEDIAPIGPDWTARRLGSELSRWAALKQQYEGDSNGGLHIIGWFYADPSTGIFSPRIDIARLQATFSPEAKLFLLINPAADQGAFYLVGDGYFAPTGGFYEALTSADAAPIVPWTGEVRGASRWLGPLAPPAVEATPETEIENVQPDQAEVITEPSETAPETEVEDRPDQAQGDAAPSDTVGERPAEDEDASGPSLHPYLVAPPPALVSAASMTTSVMQANSQTQDTSTTVTDKIANSGRGTIIGLALILGVVLAAILWGGNLSLAGRTAQTDDSSTLLPVVSPPSPTKPSIPTVHLTPTKRPPMATPTSHVVATTPPVERSATSTTSSSLSTFTPIPTATPAPTYTPAPTDSPAQPLPPKPAPPTPTPVPQSATKPASSGVAYTVQVGDNLTSIAKRYGTTVDDIVALNSLQSTTIRVGQVLAIPASGTSVLPTPSSTNSTPTSLETATSTLGAAILTAIASEPTITPQTITTATPTEESAVPGTTVVPSPTETIPATDVLPTPTETIPATDVVPSPTETIPATDVVPSPTEALPTAEPTPETSPTPTEPASNVSTTAPN